MITPKRDVLMHMGRITGGTAVYSLFCMNHFKKMYNIETKSHHIATVYKRNHSETCVVWSRHADISAHFTRSCFEWGNGNLNMRRFLPQWCNSLHPVNEKHMEIKKNSSIKWLYWILNESNQPKLTCSVLLVNTHHQGDAEVIGDVLEGQHRHWPQVMGPLREE